MCAEHQYNFFHIYHDRYQNHCTVVILRQEYLVILAASKLGEEKQELAEHKLVNTKSMDCLWKVTAEVFEVFCIAEQIFKKKQKHVLITLMISS